jgi:hypothetical protein
MARDLQKVEKEIRNHIKALNKEARLWERTLSRAQHTRIGAPHGFRRGGKRAGGK